MREEVSDANESLNKDVSKTPMSVQEIDKITGAEISCGDVSDYKLNSVGLILTPSPMDENLVSCIKLASQKSQIDCISDH